MADIVAERVLYTRSELASILDYLRSSGSALDNRETLIDVIECLRASWGEARPALHAEAAVRTLERHFRYLARQSTDPMQSGYLETEAEVAHRIAWGITEARASGQRLGSKKQ
jgi:hypothetical protein